MTNYLIYPTLLDGFERYKNSTEFADKDLALQELLNKINRVPFSNEAMSIGIALQDLVDNYLVNCHTPIKEDELFYVHKNLDASVLIDIVNRLYGSVRNWYTEAFLPTKYGKVLLYGKVDYILGNDCIDLKYTASYELGKYKDSAQRLTYPYCLKKEGVFIETMTFLASDLKGVYPEQYSVADEDEAKLTAMVCDFIEFIEAHRHLITDKKIFGGIV